METERQACDRDINQWMEEINAQNALARDAPLGRGGVAPGSPVSTAMEYLDYGTDMGLPFLPFAFNCVCGMCGKNGIQPGGQNLMPLSFLGVLLTEVYARTPFVFNILYQMAFHPELEIVEAVKWQKVHGVPVPDFLRGRVCICTECMPPIEERAQSMAMKLKEMSKKGLQRPPLRQQPAATTASPSTDVDVSPAPLLSGEASFLSSEVQQAIEIVMAGEEDVDGSGYVVFDPEVVESTEAAFKNSFDQLSDVWEIQAGARIMPAASGPDDIYEKEAGRKFRKAMRIMLPMDLVIMMVCHPSTSRVPEYRMLNRILRTLAGMSSGAVEDNSRLNKPKMKCLYLSFPLMPLHMVVAQVRSGQIELKGMSMRDRGTISDRVHISAYTSGGKRRATKGDSQHAVVARMCHEKLYNAGIRKTDLTRRLVHLGGVKA